MIENKIKLNIISNRKLCENENLQPVMNDYIYLKD